MILLLLFIVNSMGIYICTEDISSVPSIDKCKEIVKIDSELVGTDDNLLVCLRINSYSSFSFLKHYGESVSYYYYGCNSDCVSCMGRQVAFSETIDSSQIVIQANYKGTTLNKQNVFLKRDDTVLAHLLVVGDVCILGTKYVSTQFGVSVHVYNDNQCLTTYLLTNIITDKYNELDATVKKVEVTDGNEYTLDDANSNIQFVEPYLTSYTITSETKKIVEITSTTSGIVYTKEEGTVFSSINSKKLNVLITNGNIASGKICEVEDCSSANGKLYLFPICVDKKLFSVVGDVVVEITHEDFICKTIKSVVSSKNSILTIDESKYLLNYNFIKSEGNMYNKLSEIECDVYSLGKCLTVSGSVSKKVSKNSEGKTVLESFSSPDCSTGLSITYLEEVEDSNPFDDSDVTIIESNSNCDVKQTTNAVISKIIKLDKCDDKTKYTIEEEEVIKYSFENLEYCESNKNGSKEISDVYKCGGCVSNKYSICPEIKENSSSGSNKDEGDEGSSNSNTVMVASLLFILFLMW